MHELSVVLSIIDIAEKEMKKVNASCIDEIELDIGMLSGIEMNAFDFAWKQAIINTVLDKASLKINRLQGKATCLECSKEFMVENLYDGCQFCGNQLVEIAQGKEMKVKTLIVS